MRYKLIKINKDTEGNFIIDIVKIEGDRINEQQPPNPNGWYYVPESKDNNTAINELIECMLLDTQEEINKLRNYYNKIENLLSIKIDNKSD